MKSVTFKRLFLTSAASMMLALPSLASAACPVGQIETNNVCAAPTPDQALTLLRQGNELFSGGDLARLRSFSTPSVRTELSAGQHPYAIVLTCSDSRLPAEILFDKGMGEIFTVRVAGNVVAKHELGSIEYAVEHLGAKLIVVLGHERCGAVQTTYDVHGTDHSALGDNLNSLVNSIDPAVTTVLAAEGGKAGTTAGQKAQVEECVVENIKMVTESLEAQSAILREKLEKGELKIVKAKYDLDSGLANYFVCGAANGADFTAAPTTGFCTFGTFSGLSTTATGWSWSCNGTDSVAYADCSANIKAIAPVALYQSTTNTTGKFTISWSPSATTGATYLVEMDNGSGFQTLTTTTATNTVVTVPASGTYTLRVRAEKTNYVPSSWITGKPITVALTCSAPANIYVPASNTTGKVQVNWSLSDCAGAEYRLEMSTNNGATWNSTPAYTGTNAYAILPGMTNGNYLFRVMASNSPTFASSGWKTATAQTNVTLTCSTPANIYVPTTSSTGNVQLNWSITDAPNATYRVEVSTNNGATWDTTNPVYVGPNAWVKLTNLPNGTYKYRVQASNIPGGYVTSGWKVSVSNLSVLR